MSAGFENLKSIKFDDPQSVRCWGVFTKLVFDFHIREPLFQYRRENGDVIWLPDRNGKTDFASTPPPLWSLPMFAPWRFRYSATVHDQGYLHHWLYINGSRVWVERKYMDKLLEEMICYEPDHGNKLAAQEALLAQRPCIRDPKND